MQCGGDTRGAARADRRAREHFVLAIFRPIMAKTGALTFHQTLITLSARPTYGNGGNTTKANLSET